MNITIPLKLRGALIDIDLSVKPCGPGCLLETRGINSVIPTGFDGADGYIKDNKYIYETNCNTQIKRIYDRASHEVYENWKAVSSVQGVGKIVSFCSCSIEFERLHGNIPQLVDSIHYRCLSTKYELFIFNGEAQVFKFLNDALRILREIGELGYVHVDPVYWNFLFDGDRAVIIDLNDLSPVNDRVSAIQSLRVVEYLIAPFTRLKFGGMFFFELCSLAQHSGVIPYGFDVILEMVRMANRSHESAVSHLKAATELAHVSFTYREAKRTYERYLADLREGIRTAVAPSIVDVPIPVVSSAIAIPSRQYVDAIMRKESEAKEAVIGQLKDALTAYRAAFWVAGPIIRPLGFLARHIRAMLRPRLGNLNQYPPRELHLPPSFVSTLPPQQLPKISIVTPSFGQGALIGRTIDSVLKQNYPQLQYFVQDGGSTDSTVEVLKTYSSRLTGWESVKDGGQSHAINLGFAKIQGEIMAWLNSDDLLLPGALACVGDYFARHPEVDVVYGHRILIDEQDMEIGRWILPPHIDSVLSWVDFVPQETLFWRRSIWEKAGGQIDESFRFAMDWDLLLRFRQAGAHMVRLPRFLGAFRIHEAQKTSAVINEVGRQEMDRLRQRELGRVVSRPEIRRALLPYTASHIAHHLAHRLRQRLTGGA